jgi:hypothetical protein
MANRRILSRATGFGKGGKFGFALSLGTSSKVVEVLSKVVVYLEAPVPVCDLCWGGIVVSVNGRGDQICSEGIGFALSSRTEVYADVRITSPCIGS